ncbi:hypothetical protein BC332_00921, partial [Capsicum chinense]
MVNLLEKLFGSFVSAITSYFHYHQPHDQTHYQGTNKHKMTKSRPISLQTVELKVRMCCSGCERVIKDAVFKLRGVESVSVELEMEKVTVVGYVERNKVLKAVRRHGKRAEFWPNPNPPLYFTSSSHYFKDMTTE